MCYIFTCIKHNILMYNYFIFIRTPIIFIYVEYPSCWLNGNCNRFIRHPVFGSLNNLSVFY